MTTPTPAPTPPTPQAEGPYYIKLIRGVYAIMRGDSGEIYDYSELETPMDARCARYNKEWLEARAEGYAHAHATQQARIDTLTAELSHYGQAMLLAFGGVCPPHWAYDGSNPQATAEAIRRRGDEMQAEIDTLTAQLAAAREALESIADGDLDYLTVPGDHSDIVQNIKKYARTALGAKP